MTWLKDNIPIVPSNHVVPRGEVLLLQYMRPDMDGYYTCQLDTEFGTKSVTTQVTVKGEEKYFYTNIIRILSMAE